MKRDVRHVMREEEGQCLVDGGALDGHDLFNWRPPSVEEAACLLRALPAPWWIAGGWAIDLFLGRQTRPHDDLDVQVLRRAQLAVQRHLAGWDLQAAGGGRLRPWGPGEWLASLIDGVWGRPTRVGPWAIDIVLADTDGGQWVFRRNPRITRPLGEFGRLTADGIPYIAPEVQLLFKAKEPRPKDEADFALVVPHLDRASRQWLAGAIADTHPSHPWLARL